MKESAFKTKRSITAASLTLVLSGADVFIIQNGVTRQKYNDKFQGKNIFKIVFIWAWVSPPLSH